jgi:hypothetical protein
MFFILEFYFYYYSILFCDFSSRILHLIVIITLKKSADFVIILQKFVQLSLLLAVCCLFIGMAGSIVSN